MARIALIAGSYQPDRCGVADYTARLRSVLADRGMSSTVLTTYKAADTIRDRTVQGVVNHWQSADLLPLVRAVHRVPADILHIQHAAGTYGFERSLFLLPLLLRFSGWRKPIVTTIHEYGWWEWQPRWIPSSLLEGLKTWGQRRGWWDREDGFLLTCSDAIITTNRDAETVIRERLPELNDRLFRIPIAANVEVVDSEPAIARHELRQQCQWADETTVIAFFGFLHPVKGLETLLPAFKQVVTAHPHARLLLIGGVESLALRGEDATAYWQRLHHQVAELGLASTVHLTGYVPVDVASRYLAGADLGVLPFNHGVNLKSGSLLTLLAHGLPTVATQHPTPDLDLLDASPIRLVNPRQVDELAAALTELLRNSALRSQLQAAGHALAKQFTWAGIADAHLTIYQQVMSPGNLFRQST